MIFVLKKKGFVIIVDVLLFVILILIILLIQTKIIINYNNDVQYFENKKNILLEDFFIDLYLLDCNYLGYFENNTKKCYSNKIEIKNLDCIDKNLFCKIKIDDQIIIDNKTVKNTHKRGVVYNNKFSILKVGFCEK